MRFLVLACLSILIAACGKKVDSKKSGITDLELQILDSIHHYDGEFAVAFKNLDSLDEAFFINKSTNFHAASTMKTPVMIEAYKQVQEGTLDLNDSIRVTNRFVSIINNSWYELEISDDSEPLLYQSIGQFVPIHQLIELMITESSNLANNLMIDRLGAGNITQTMAELGADGLKVRRGVEDIKAFEQEINNTTDAFSLMVIYQRLASGTIVSDQACREMIEILKRQKFNDVIPALLPDEVTVAHKTGSITGVHHDSGIVYLPDGRKYVLVLLSKNLTNFEQGTRLLQNISRLVYDYMISNTTQTGNSQSKTS